MSLVLRDEWVQVNLIMNYDFFYLTRYKCTYTQ